MLTLLALMFATQTVAAETNPPAADKIELICRQGERETGSHRRTGKRCKTAEEWEKEDGDRTRMSPSAQITTGQPDALTKSSPQ